MWWRRGLVELAVACAITVFASAAAAQVPPTTPDPKTPPVNGNGKPEDTKASGEKTVAAAEQLPTPPMPKKMQELREKVENSALVRHLINHEDGFYPRGFSIWTGAGISAGLGYRRHVFSDRALFDVSGEYSTRGYRLIEGSVEVPMILREGLFTRADARYRYFPQEDYFGIAGASRIGLRSTYLLRTSEVWGTFGGRRKGVTAGVELGWLGVGIGRGTDTRFPSVHELFADESAPGLIDQPNYLRSGVFLDLNRLDNPGYPRRGTHSFVTFNDYRDLTFNRYSFKRLDLETSGFLPIMNDRDVIAARVRVTFANNKPGHQVPFYMYPTLGGGSSMRAFDEFRYRDENALLLNAEYRLGVHKMADIALFGDAGKVAHDFQGINPKGLIADYGVGVRFHTATRTLFRFDVAHGREGTRYMFKMNRPF
jgi:surface antigen Omp85-like protein